MPLNDLEGVQLHLSAKEGWIFMSVAWGVVSVVVVLAFLKEFVFGRCSCCQRGRERLSFDEIARYGSRGKVSFYSFSFLNNNAFFPFKFLNQRLHFYPLTSLFFCPFSSSIPRYVYYFFPN